jgi:hypothetical protein
MARVSKDEFEQLRGELTIRKGGKLPHLPDELDDPEGLRDWLTLAFRPPEGWRVVGFERAGRDQTDPCTLMTQNGRESTVYRFKRQADVMRNTRVAVTAVSDGVLRMPHLNGGEIEDVRVALCRLGNVLTEWDERDETRKWVEQLVRASLPLTGHTLVPDGRHAALMALKNSGEFTRTDALAMGRPGEVEGHQQRPVRFVDAQTGDEWIRAGETAAYVRWVLGVEPLSHTTLRARLYEVGVVGKLFEDYRPPHPKLNLYQLSEELTGGQK